ncbi:uncharacterized protein (TIGR02118 family) [Paraburkholderia fungorum]|jgi:uncharacterized protein (TIGR02118 family)|uniref:EthD family reductase n=1 Tax=Paraburkholderia fungorum TaxID=134537 RepID=UPI000D070431|nr:EthD family reductase [Paraburkholderia fungorum]PRZ52316.1 uncharacterized protein (TIGR02118 family) [Paraburkholderia fungorum]
MHTLFVFYPPPVSPDEFKRYYLEVHLPQTAGLPGLLTSCYMFEPAGVGEASPYFCIWQGSFVSAESIEAALQSEIGQRVAADTANFATGGVTILYGGLTDVLSTR